MVSYSRLRPAMSRDDPRRCCGVGAPRGACGAGLVPVGSVPVVLMLSPSGRQARVATDKEVLLVPGRGGVYHVTPRLSRLLYPCLLLVAALAVEAVHGGGEAVADDRLDGVG